jgi:hypothetical protein
MITESKVMKGLWMFVSYCEAYYEDSYLVKRAHLNLYLIIEIFQNIIDNAVLTKHKQSFKQQRQSMLPAKSGSSSTNDRVVDVSRLFTINADVSDLADYSLGGHSEISLTERDYKMSKSLQRALEEAFNDLEQQIRLNGRHLMSATQSSEAVLSVQGDIHMLESISESDGHIDQ